MKKIILWGITFFSLSTIGSNYVMKIDQDVNNYDIVLSYNEVLDDSGWINVGTTKNCQFDIELEDVYYNHSFSQIETCEQDQQKTIESTKTYTDGTVDVDTKIYNQTISVSTTNDVVGSLLLSSCKEILDNGHSIGTTTYRIDSTTAFDTTCDMDTDGGGWTLISVVNQTTPTSVFQYGIDDKDLNYSEILFLDGGSVNDYYTPASSNWNWTGFDVSKNMLRIGGKWRYIQSEFTASGGCSTIPESNSYTLSDYRFLESSSICFDGATPKSTCATKLVINIPNNEKLDYFSDVETQSGLCYGDNSHYYKFSLYVR